MPPLVVAQASSPGPFPDPNQLAAQISDIIRQYNIADALTSIGWALLGLFALLELYRLWLAQDAAGLPMLGVKVILVNALIAKFSPLKEMIINVYQYFASLGEAIAGNSISQQFQALTNSIFYGNPSGGGTLDFFWHLFKSIWSGGGFGYPIIFGAYVILMAIAYAVYVFLILISRLWMEVAILLIPILFPLFVWEPTSRAYASKWVNATVHAILLPLIVGLSITIAAKAGLLSPLDALNTCVNQTLTTLPSIIPGGCTSQAVRSAFSGVVGAFVMFFFIIGSDRIVSSFVGGAEITALGILAASKAMGLIMGGARAAWAAARAGQPQITRELVRTVSREEPGGVTITARETIRWPSRRGPRQTEP